MKNKISKILLLAVISMSFALGACKSPANVTYYSVIYWTEHGVAPVNKKVVSGYKLTKNDLPVLKDDSYFFDGWYSNSDNIKAGTVVKADIILVAKWKSPIGNIMAPNAVGDIVFNDGSAYSNPKYSSLSKEDKEQAVGVVAAIVKDDNNNDVYLLAALKTYYDTPWAKKGAGCFNTTPEELTPENDSYGPNNWKKIVEKDPIYTTKEKWQEYYPAFYKAMTHGVTSGYTGIFREGWYLPSVGELKVMFANYNTYGSSIGYAGGTAPYSSSYIINDKNEKILYNYALYSSNGIDAAAYSIEPGRTERNTADNRVIKMNKEYTNSSGTINKFSIGVLPVYRYSVN